LGANLRHVTPAITERGDGRIWQGKRSNGANTMTIAAGHAIDALCYVVGELQEVSARLATTIRQWHNTDTGATMDVDSPDWIVVSGHAAGGAEVSFLVATVPTGPGGSRFEIYGRDGTLAISGGSLNNGPSVLHMARGKDALAPVDIPARFTVIPESTPSGP